jgi:hypothetical protein
MNEVIALLPTIAHGHAAVADLSRLFCHTDNHCPLDKARLLKNSSLTAPWDDRPWVGVLRL